MLLKKFRNGWAQICPVTGVKLTSDIKLSDDQVYEFEAYIQNYHGLDILDGQRLDIKKLYKAFNKC